MRSSVAKFSLLVLTLAALLPAAGRAQTFSNSGTITIPNGSGSTTPASGQYPTSGTCTNSACISVSGLAGNLTSLTVSLTYASVNTQSFASPALLLVAPDGTHMLDMLSFGCGANTTTASFTLTDGATALFPHDSQCPNPLSATYKPAHYDAGVADNFPSPGPGNSGYSIPGTSGTATFASTFPSLASSLNGTWRLYAVDQGTASGNTQITSWKLNFVVTGNNDPTTTSLSAGTPDHSFTSGAGSTVSFTATVTDTTTSGRATAGTATLWDATTNSILQANQPVNGSGQASFSVVFATEGSHSVYAVYNGGSGFAASGNSNNVTQVAIHHATQAGSTFCNGPITLNNDAGGSPYPSSIVLGATNISGVTEPTLTGTIQNITVSVNGISLTNNDELDQIGLMLQAPGANATTRQSQGNAFEFLSWAGNPYTSGSLIFSDQGSAEIPPFNSPSCSNCLPTDDWSDILSSNPDGFPSPATTSIDKAPPTGSASFLSEFGGQAASGTWSLYSANRVTLAGVPGSITQWCLNFTMQANAHATTTAVTSSSNPASFTPVSHAGTATVNLTATVSSDQTVNAGTVTFVDGTTSLGSAAVSNGVATLSNVHLTEGTHQIIATYGGTNSGTVFGISTVKFDQRVDATTTPTSGSGAGPYVYCNTGAITAPGLLFDAGAAYPYPSNIFVTKMPGTVRATTLTLNQFSTKDQGDLMSLVVGPSPNGNPWNNHLDFFSLTGTSVSVPGVSNLTFSDAGANIGSTNLESSGTFAPESNETLTFPQCPPNASDCGSENVGPPLGTTSTFTPTNKASSAGTSILGNANAAGIFGGTGASTYNGNGTWSLYLDDGGPLGGGEATNLSSGWCVNLTINQPVVAPTAAHAGNGIGGNFVQGEQGAQVTVSIANNGPGSTGDPTGGSPMTVTDVLNSNLTYAGTSSGSGWTCSGTTTVTCTNDSTIALGSSYPTLGINVNVANAAPGTVPSQVSVVGAGAATVSSNSDSITVDPAPILAVSVGHTGTFTQGSTAEWDVTVSNTASGGRTNGTMTATATLPTGYTLNGSSATGGTWGCGGGANVITCTSTSQINGGSNSKIALTVNVPTTSPVSVSASATVFGGGDLVHTSSGTAATSNTDSVTVIQVPASVTITAGGTQSATVGTLYATALTALIKDAAGVVIQNYSPVSFAASTGSSGQSGTFSNTSNIIVATSDGSGQVSEAITANTKSGAFTVTVTAGSAQATFNLTNNPGAPASLSVVSDSGPNIPWWTRAPFDITALDAFGNVATSDNDPLTLTSSSLRISSDPTSLTNGTVATTIALGIAGSQTITATDTNNPSVFGTVTVIVPPGPPASFGITTPASANAGAPVSFMVTTYDIFSNVVTGYTGTATFSSTDPAALLPSPAALTGGTGTFQATFVTPGTQTITATDSVTAIAGTSAGIVITIPDLVVTVPTDDAGTASNCDPLTAPNASCSLRDALLEAASLGSANITFDPTVFASAQSITPTFGTLTIPHYTTLTGPTTGSGLAITNLVTIQGSGSVASPVSTPLLTVGSGAASTSVSNLILRDNINGSGPGAVSNAGSLTMTHISFVSNQSLGGDGGNGAGGAISNTGALSVSNSTFGDNGADSPGAIGNGGAIFNSGAAAVLNLMNTTFRGNVARTNGGAIFNSGNSSVTAINSTFRNNQAAEGFGGAIWNSTTSTVSVSDSTFSGNIARDAGGGGAIDNRNTNSGSLIFANTIASGNSANFGGADDVQDASGSVSNATGNVIGVLNGTATGSPAINLAPLANYGGNTQTMLPLPGSPAICGGLAASIPSGVTTDQRGMPNTNNSYNPGTPCIDSGAVQTNYALTFTQQPSTSGSTATVGVGRVIAPAPAVSVIESSTNNVTGASVTLSDASGSLAGTETRKSASGIATFSGVFVAQVFPSDTLTATLPLNPATPLSLTTTSFPFNVSPIVPALTAPSGPAPISGSTQFTWDPGAGVQAFRLKIGVVGPGSSDIFDSTNLAKNVTSQTVNIPANGATIYVRLAYIINGTSDFIDYTFTGAGTSTAPTLTAPSGAGAISGSTAFTWDPGAGARYFHLRIGINQPGSADIYDSGNLPGTVNTETVTIPANGVNVFVRLSYFEDGVWKWVDYTFPEAGTAVAPSLTAPSGMSSLSGSTLFTWDPGTGSEAFLLKVGTTPFGSDIFNSGKLATTVTSETVNIPATTVFVQLGYEINGVWLHKEYTFGVTAPALTAPSGPALLSGSTQFTWDPGMGSTTFRLKVGTAGPSSADLADTGDVPTSVTSVSVNVPANGAIVYVRLAYIANGIEQHLDYTFTEAGTVTPPALIAPSGPTPISGSTLFSWNPGAGSTAFRLKVGTSAPGSSDLTDTGNVATSVTSATANVPANGGAVYVRLSYIASTVEQHIDYTFTEGGSVTPPALTSPSGPTPISGSTLFTWDAGAGSTTFRVRVGTAGPGSADLADTGNVPTTVTSVTANVPANGGAVYVRLAYSANAVEQHIDYTFTESGTVTPPSLTSPSGAAPLSGSTLFTWNPGAGSSLYHVKIGTIAPGSNDLADTGNVNATVTSISANIPTGGGTVYVRIGYLTPAGLQHVDYTFTEAP
ncbi:MAG TPA: Ig-like domain repeat protein [Terracidiphilus sp.]